MLDVWRFLAERYALRLADAVMTSPGVRWTWTGFNEGDFIPALSDFRPTDRESVREMMAGRYLLASRIVDTGGVSPFAIEIEHEDWLEELHVFSWLRHFRDARDGGERRFAVMLVLDWIGRHGAFDPQSWQIGLSARRVLNWLRHIGLLLDGANPDEARAIKRSLNTQIHALRIRWRLATEPVDRLLAVAALLAVALSSEGESGVDRWYTQIMKLIGEQFSADGMHLSRGPGIQFVLLTQLVTVRQALSRRHPDRAQALGERLDAMHRALDSLMLGTGEPAYFNGCGPLQVDLVHSVQAQSTERRAGTGTVGGYGVLVGGQSVVVADSGHVPPLAFSARAHASALAFEFSHGHELVVGNCGPAPAGLWEGGEVFRRSIAHSGLTIDDESNANVHDRWPLAGYLSPIGPRPSVRADPEAAGLVMVCDAYLDRHGVGIERRLTLIAGGNTLVGQDRLVVPQGRRPSGHCVIRFHLAPGAEVERVQGQHVINIQLKSGRKWAFVWEGAVALIEESVRHTAHFGLARSSQIVLEVQADGDREVSWIFSRHDS